VKAHYFNDTDHTHTIEKGAETNAKIVAKLITNLSETDLKSFLNN